MAIFSKPDDFHDYPADFPETPSSDQPHGQDTILEVDTYIPQNRSLSVPRARRELKKLMGDLQLAKHDLRLLQLGEPIARSPLLIDALVSAATDYQMPLHDSPQISDYRRQAARGELDDRAQLADDELDSAVLAVTSGLGALDAASVLDEPIPHAWSNLPALDLARKLTRLGHGLLRGRIPGVSI